MAQNCVRVDPPCVQFNDVKVGRVYKTTVTAANVGKTLKKLSFEKPTLKLFKFSTSSPSTAVAPGLSVSCLLEFTPQREEEVKDYLRLCVDDLETIEIPLLVFPWTCSFLMDPELDFGCISASSQVITKHQPLTNQGSAPGKFQVQYSGNPSVTLSPCSGVIAAGTTQWLKVELRTDRPRRIEERALVKLQNCSPVVLTIRAEVVEQHLETFDVQGGPLSCLRFGPVYFGTSRVENVVLRNNAPQACNWVCLIQDIAAGTELGTDLQKSTDAALLDRLQNCTLDNQDVSQVFVCDPNQGRLEPYEKTTLRVYFIPLCKSKKKKHLYSASRQDYSLFLLFDSVGSKHGFTQHNGNCSVELGVTGSGLPVSLVPNPSQSLDFLTCVTGQRVDLLCVLQNFCSELPINFRFRRLALFKTEPSTGTIAPGQCQDVIFSFNARQQGSFEMRQILDVIGSVFRRRGDNTAADITGLEFRSFHTITLHLSAVCRSETTHPEPKLNPGMTPALTNPTGSWPFVRSSDLARCGRMVYAAVLSAAKTRLHTHRSARSQSSEREEFVAFPNDRAASIRHASQHTPYRTIFTGVRRYHYVDPDYAFTEKEVKQRRQHRQIYTDFMKLQRQTRLQKINERQQEKVENDLDIGIVPAQGLVPPELLLRDLETIKITKAKPGRCISASSATGSRVLRDATKLTEVMNAVPSTSQEVADCSRALTAQELCQVVISPLSVDFGDVCVQSVCMQRLELTNHLPVYVWVQLAVDCPELLGSSPLSHVLQPRSHTTLHLIFQSNKQGVFYRPVSYSVNQRHPGQILVQANVVSVALEMSVAQLVLCPTPTLLAQSGYRGFITLRNKLNLAAEFTWKPVVTERGILFSIRPATGAVEPFKELDCEVVWHPSFSSPAEGDFDLCVHEGSTQRLHCTAKVGTSSVKLAENLLTFGSVPLNMPSIRTAVLNNTGQNHAYYQVLDVYPLSGMMVSPSEGVVPSGGQAFLQIHFNPDSVIKFDTRVEIALRNMKPIELRVGGSVEPPDIDISVSHFQFHGVYNGSRRALPFSLANRSLATARVTFDLSEYSDFTLQCPQPSADKARRVTVVEVQAHQTVACSMVFSPKQVAGYEFDIPMMVNGVSYPIPSSLSFPTTPSSSTICSSASSRKHVVTPASWPVSMTTGSRRVHVTVLCAPLEMSPSSLQFVVEPLALQSDARTKTVELRAVGEKSVCWRGVGESVCWWFDCSAAVQRAGGRREVELFTVSPSSGSLGPGQSVCVSVSIMPEAIGRVSGKVTKLSLPFYLGKERFKGKGEEHHLYRELSITIIQRLPNITIHPPQILLTPVPLQSSITSTFTLLAVGYPSGTRISAEVAEFELDDGAKVQPVTVTFPQGNTIPAQSQPIGIHNQEANETTLMCTVSFCSAVPMSLCTTITFTDHLDNRFQVKLCATADNCLLTVWPYLALSCSQQHIVLKTGVTNDESGYFQTILQHCHSPSPTSVPASSSSSSFDHVSSTSKNSDSFPECESANGQASSEEDNDTTMNPGIPDFPAANSEDGLYCQSVLLAVERWFSLFGWPNGPNPISIPHTLRVVPNVLSGHSSHRSFRVVQIKSSRSVLDMLHHLTGKQIPGIAFSQSFSSDITQRVHQLLQQHKAMLAFLRVQGACLCHIRPEYLLDKQEFQHWHSMQANEEANGLSALSTVVYESLSKRSWTDVLLQIYKVLVLCRVSESSLNTNLKQEDIDETVPVSSQPLSSNIYSPWELRLLSWLNMHFQHTRKTVWDGVPSARWIVNFDLDLADGLVLASLLASYCPYLIYSHFRRMYTRAASLEQKLHNNIIVAQALTTLSLTIDTQPTDLSDPNPVQMLMLCVHLYERLPQYLPLQTITLSGGLHKTFSKQVRLKSPCSKPLRYRATLLGEEAHLFSLPNGPTVTIPPKSSSELTVHYCCAVLQPVEAILLLTSSSAFGQPATTLTFKLKTRINHIASVKTVKCKSPCYQLKMVPLPITNLFNKEAKFRVVLEESKFNPLEPEKEKDSLFQQTSKTNSPPEEMTSDRSFREKMDGKSSDLNGEASEFCSTVESVCLQPGQADTLNICYLPFHLGIKYCSVLLVCPQVGDIVCIVKATAELPLPSPLTARPSPNIAPLLSNSDAGVCESVLSLYCKVGQVCEEVVSVPLVNTAREQALAIWGEHTMSVDERKRRMLTQTLHSSTVRATTAARQLNKEQVQLMRGVSHSKGVEYSVEVSMPEHFTLPQRVTIPIGEDTNTPQLKPADCQGVDIPLRFLSNSVGQFPCRVVMSSWCDTRVYLLEALVTSQVDVE